MFSNDFNDGVLFAAAILMNDHDEPVYAADILRAADLEKADCSRMDDMDKMNLKKINNEKGIRLKGL